MTRIFGFRNDWERLWPFCGARRGGFQPDFQAWWCLGRTVRCLGTVYGNWGASGSVGWCGAQGGAKLGSQEAESISPPREGTWQCHGCRRIQRGTHRMSLNLAVGGSLVASAWERSWRWQAAAGWDETAAGWEWKWRHPRSGVRFVAEGPVAFLASLYPGSTHTSACWVAARGLGWLLLFSSWFCYWVPGPSLSIDTAWFLDLFANWGGGLLHLLLGAQACPYRRNHCKVEGCSRGWKPCESHDWSFLRTCYMPGLSPSSSQQCSEIGVARDKSKQRPEAPGWQVVRPCQRPGSGCSSAISRKLQGGRAWFCIKRNFP